MRRTPAVLLALLALLPLTACGGSGKTTLTVLAASSLTETFTQLGQAFESRHPDVTVRFAFDSSATLAQQAGTPKVFATNVMVLATPADNPAHLTSFADLDRGSVKYVVCVPTAPCGIVAQALLAQDHITAKPVSTEVDVKSVLAKVTEGEADAGLVYTTDAIAAGSQVTHLPIPGSSKQTTTYPIVALDQAKHADLAQQFVDLVTGPTGQQVLARAGFGKP